MRSADTPTGIPSNDIGTGKGYIYIWLICQVLVWLALELEMVHEEHILLIASGHRTRYLDIPDADALL